MARLFVALIPPATVRTELAETAERIEGVRWTPADNIHLTLRFLGETDDTKRDRYVAALAGVRVESFILPVRGTGLFPSRGPAHVLWAGIGNSHPRLFQLRQQVDEALLRIDGGLDVRSFHPHFTLARLTGQASAKAVAAWMERHAALEAPPFRVEQFDLMESELSPDRPPRYRSVQSFALSAR